MCTGTGTERPEKFSDFTYYIKYKDCRTVTKMGNSLGLSHELVFVT